MKKMFDYGCTDCDNLFEALTSEDETVPCPRCGSLAVDRRITGGKTFTVIQATTPTSKRYKAGYVHKFQKRPAEKISVQVPASPTKT